MRQAYDYWQDQPDNYLRVITPEAPLGVFNRWETLRPFLSLGLKALRTLPIGARLPFDGLSLRPAPPASVSFTTDCFVPRPTDCLPTADLSTATCVCLRSLTKGSACREYKAFTKAFKVATEQRLFLHCKGPENWRSASNANFTV